MEQEITKEEKIDRIIEMLSSFQYIIETDKYEPAFKVGRKITQIAVTDSDALEWYYSNEYTDIIKNQGIFIELDEDGIITKISDDLLDRQKINIRLETIDVPNIIKEKNNIYSMFNVKEEVNEIDDIVGFDQDQFSNLLDYYSRVDYDKYKVHYLHTLSTFSKHLASIRADAFKKENYSLKNYLKEFDKYYRDVFNYYLDNSIEGNPYKIKEYGNIKLVDIIDTVNEAFKPKMYINVSSDIHDNNHKQIIKHYDDQTKLNKFLLCKSNIKEILEDYSSASLNLKNTDKIVTLLNIRENYLTMYKIYKSYNIFKRWFYNDVKELGRDLDKSYNKIISEVGISKKDLNRFLDNKHVNIRYNGKTYDYNKLYTESNIYNNNIVEFRKEYNNVYKDNFSILDDFKQSMTINTDLEKSIDSKELSK